MTIVIHRTEIPLDPMLLARARLYFRGMGQNGKPLIPKDDVGDYKVWSGLGANDKGRVLLGTFDHCRFWDVLCGTIEEPLFYRHVRFPQGGFDDDPRSVQNGYIEKVSASELVEPFHFNDYVQFDTRYSNSSLVA